MEHKQEEKLKEEQEEKKEENSVKLPQNCKERRYYYRHREAILEKQKLARLAKKGVDITKIETETPLEERRRKKMEFLGLLEDSKIDACVPPGD